MKMNPFRQSLKAYTVDSHHPIDPKISIERAKERLRGMGKGLFGGLLEIGYRDSFGLPIYKVLGSHLYNEWGKGITPEQSKASALMERIERISASAKFQPIPHAIHSSFLELSKPAISRKEFGLCNVHHILYPQEKMDDLKMDWLPITSVSKKEEVFVPAQLVYLSYPTRNFRDYWCSTGLASGNSFEEAFVQALCEVVERHVFHRMHFGMPRLRGIDLSTLKNPLAKSAVSNLEKKGYEIVAADFSDGWGICSIGVHIIKPDDGIIFPGYIKCGTSLDPEIAFIRAFTEIGQNRAVFLHTGHFAASKVWLFSSAGEEQKKFHEWFSHVSGNLSFEELPNLSSEDFGEEAESAVKEVARQGYDALAHDLTHPELKTPVVRVLIPGLQPNFLVKGYHHLDKRSCVTHHLPIHGEVMERLKRRDLLNQRIDEEVDVGQSWGA